MMCAGGLPGALKASYAREANRILSLRRRREFLAMAARLPFTKCLYFSGNNGDTDGEASLAPSGRIRIDRPLLRAAGKRISGAYGLLDDAAVIAPAAGCELVVKTDAIIGGVHFLPDDPADLVARKALRVNLSDLAAKGARPVAYMLDLALPSTVDEGWVAAFARGLASDQAEYNMHLIGGDTDWTPGAVTIAIMAFGEIATGRIIRRGGAQAGDQILVSGTIGDAALGLRALRGQLSSIGVAAAQFLAGRYRLPLPRVTLGPRLIGLATAALDVSDGLIADLRHICETSGLAAIIETQRVPLSRAARAAIATDEEGLALALTGGDDYEILFTAPPSAADDLADVSQAARHPDHRHRAHGGTIGRHRARCPGAGCSRPAGHPRARGLGPFLELEDSGPALGSAYRWRGAREDLSRLPHGFARFRGRPPADLVSPANGGHRSSIPEDIEQNAARTASPVQARSSCSAPHRLVWFPEGWRTTDGLLRPFLPGIGALVLRKPVPIVLVAHRAHVAVWPAQQRFPQPRRIVVRATRRRRSRRRRASCRRRA